MCVVHSSTIPWVRRTHGIPSVYAIHTSLSKSFGCFIVRTTDFRWAHGPIECLSHKHTKCFQCRSKSLRGYFSNIISCSLPALQPTLAYNRYVCVRDIHQTPNNNNKLLTITKQLKRALINIMNSVQNKDLL